MDSRIRELARMMNSGGGNDYTREEGTMGLNEYGFPK